jgi:hypothetical protein
MSPPPSNASTVCATGQTAQVDVGQERTAAGKLVGCAAGKLVRGSAQARDLLAEAEHDTLFRGAGALRGPYSARSTYYDLSPSTVGPEGPPSTRHRHT